MKLPVSNTRPQAKPENKPKSKFITLGSILSAKNKNKNGQEVVYFKSNVYCGKSKVTGENLMGKLYLVVPQEDGEQKFFEVEMASVIEPLPDAKKRAPYVHYNLTVALDKLTEIKGE